MLANLRKEMTRRKVSVGQIAELLKVRRATAGDKLNGKYRFYYKEAAKIRDEFFPECTLEYLFEDEQAACKEVS